jgi:hypothetical protein
MKVKKRIVAIFANASYEKICREIDLRLMQKQPQITHLFTEARAGKDGFILPQ